MELGHHYLETVTARFRSVKALADAAVAQLTDDGLHHVPAEGANSVAVTMKHIAGNQRSRWTDFLESDGEKPWRNRDREFEEAVRTRAEILEDWESGWQALFDALAGLTPDDLLRDVEIRGEPQSVVSAIERQLSHYSYHVGQIVHGARMLQGEAWQSLSIPRGESEAYTARLQQRREP